MQRISRNIFISVMLHSVLLAAVAVIGNSSQQPKKLLIVSLFDEWQKGETASPVQSLSGGSTQKTPTVLAEPPAQRRALDRVSPAQVRDATTGVQAGAIPAPSVQTPTAMSEKRFEPAGIPGELHRGFQGERPEGRPETATLEGAVVSSGKDGPVTGVSGTGSSGKERRTEESDPGVRKKIRDILQTNLVYPYLARKKRIEGTVLTEFRLNNSGMPENMRIVRTSNYAILDEAAKETIQRAAPFPAQNRRVEIPITFRLREGE